MRESIYRAYLDEVWQIDNSTVISPDMRNAVCAGDVAECVRLFNTLFLLSLRGSGLEARGEVHGSVERSDIEIVLQDIVVVL